MAKKMVLVPADNLEHTEEVRDMSALAEMLPKSYQSRGKALLKLLKGKVQLDSRDHVVYENGEKGSHIVDLVRYFVTPKHLKVTRPFDSNLFYSILIDLGTPTSLMARANTVNSSWVHVHSLF